MRGVEEEDGCGGALDGVGGPGRVADMGARGGTGPPRVAGVSGKAGEGREY